MFVIVTYKFGVATLTMAVALASLLVQRERVRVPKFLWLFRSLDGVGRGGVCGDCLS